MLAIAYARLARDFAGLSRAPPKNPPDLFRASDHVDRDVGRHDERQTDRQTSGNFAKFCDVDDVFIATSHDDVIN